MLAANTIAASAISMATSVWHIAWGQVLVTAALSIGGSIAVNRYTTKLADLVYESFPPAQVATAASEVSIYNVRVDNVGTKEVANVEVFLALPAGQLIEDVQVKPSLSSIDYVIARRTDNAFEVTFPLLNAGEGSQFSLLVPSNDSAQPTVEVRGNGIVGRQRRPNDDTTLQRVNAVLQPIALTVAIVAVLLAIATSFRQLRGFLQRSFSQQLQAVRTHGAASSNTALGEQEMSELLTTAIFRFFFNPGVSLDKSKTMRFGTNGIILEGNNKKEASWRVKNGFLEFLTAKGQVNSRFYYSPSDRTFYQIPDQDTSAVSVDGIADQYMMAVAAVPGNPS